MLGESFRYGWEEFHILVEIPTTAGVEGNKKLVDLRFKIDNTFREC